MSASDLKKPVSALCRAQTWDSMCEAIARAMAYWYNGKEDSVPESFADFS